MKQTAFWIITVITTICSSFLVLLSFYEWWNVKIKADVDSYPWGPINENSWYYTNEHVYANYMLLTGFLALFPLILVWVYILKRNQTKALYAVLGCFLVFIFVIINSMIR